MFPYHRALPRLDLMHKSQLDVGVPGYYLVIECFKASPYCSTNILTF